MIYGPSRTRMDATGTPLGIKAAEGSGSLGTLYVGNCKTTVKDRKKEIGKGLLAKMLGDPGIAGNDLEAAERRNRP